MGKRAVDLSSEELAAMGAQAALRAAKKAQDAGLSVTGTVDFLENGQAVSKLAQRQPSGLVVVFEDSVNSDATATDSSPSKDIPRQSD